MFYCLVAGSRTFTDYDLLQKKLNEVLKDKEGVEIVEGGARGADALAARYAREHGYGLREFPADWSRHGRAAGYVRNEEMFEYISQFPDRFCILFWDGKSPGTKHSLALSERFSVEVDVVRF